MSAIIRNSGQKQVERYPIRVADASGIQMTSRCKDGEEGKKQTNPSGPFKGRFRSSPFRVAPRHCQVQRWGTPDRSIDPRPGTRSSRKCDELPTIYITNTQRQYENMETAESPLIQLRYKWLEYLAMIHADYFVPPPCVRERCRFHQQPISSTCQTSQEVAA